MNDLSSPDWDAIATAQAIRQGAVSRTEVLDAAVRRARDAEPLGAIVSTSFERARAATLARASLQAPFAGVPTFIKDLVQVEGVRTTWGSAASGHHVSTRSDPIAREIEALGFATLGKSATPELGLTGTTEPLSQRPCRNPWAPAHSAGGSSGGAAALVAAGVVPLAHANDGGGSIRIPASCCGLVGHKPSSQRFDLPASALLPVNIACEGVVTRSVRDTIAFWRAIQRGRPAPFAMPLIGEVHPHRGAKLRIALFTDAPAGTPVHPAVVQAVERAGRLCEDLGHAVESIPSPFSPQVIDDFLAYWKVLAWGQANLGRLMLHPRWDRRLVEPFTRDLADGFASAPAAAFASIRRLRAFRRSYPRLIANYDVLLCPTLATPPPKLQHLRTDLPFETAIERLREYVAFTPIQNIAGAPAISLPLGRTEDGLPLGVQLAGVLGDDQRLLELALALEEASPWPLIAPTPRWRDEPRSA